VLPFRASVDAKAGASLWRRMRASDVVHAQDRRAGLWVRLAPGLRSVARIYSVHGLPDAYMPPPMGTDSPSLRDRIAYEWIDARLCRRADAVLIPSEALAKVFADRLGFPSERIRVVPNGVAVPDHPRAPGTEVGTLSLLEPVKDIPTFLTAASLLAAERPEVRFVVFGDGGEREALRRQAATLGIADRVDFPGYVQADAALQRLRVLVLPSIVENAPMAMLEAMAAGVPVVASRTGGIPELAGQDTAVLVDPGDVVGFARAIARLLDDPDYAASRSAAGRERVAARFTDARNAEATHRVYEHALATRRRR
jgi:glycosyltransferase involved in cell wall biosynthesis